MEGGAVQVDGTAAEFNIDPANTIGRPTGNIAKVVTTMTHMMQEKRQGAKFTPMPTRKYTKRNWMGIPDSAKEMGCDPDFNCYTVRKTLARTVTSRPCVVLVATSTSDGPTVWTPLTTIVTSWIVVWS